MNTILAPRTASAEAVRETLVGWSRSGLLSPFTWWSPDPGEAEVSVQSDLVAGGSAQEMSLGTALRGASERPRLVALYPLHPGEGADTAFADLAERAVQQFDRLLPPEDERPPSCTMVVAPGTTGQPVPAELFQNLWAANVYVVPEDRPDPQETDQLVGTPELFTVHAAHAVAVLAGLWTGQSPTQLLDALWQRRRPNTDQVQLVRCVSRGIEYGYFADDLAAHVFRPLEHWPNPDRAKFEIDSEPSGTIERVAAKFGEAHRDVIGLPKFEDIELEEPEYPSLLEAIRMMLARWWAILRRKPRDLLEERIVAPTYERWRRFVAAHGGPRAKPWFDRRPEDRGLLEAGGELTGPLYVTDGPVGETWRQMRETSFGLVDGASVPEAVAGPLARSRERRAVVVNPHVIVPDPQELPPRIQGAAVRACDPLAARERRELLEAAVAAAAAASSDAEGQAGFEAPSPPQPDPPSEAPAGGDEASGEGDEVGVTTQAAEPVTVAEAVVSASGAPDPAADPVLIWAAERRGSLLWRVGEGIVRALRQAQAEAEAELPEPPHSDPVALAKERAKRQSRTALRFLVGLLVRSLVVLVLSVGAIFLIGFPLCVIAWVVLAVLWCWRSARSLLRALRAEQDEYSDEANRDLRYLNATLRRATREGDAIRLRRRYAEYLDWAEIIGWYVHRPLVGEPLDSVEMAAPLDSRALPSAFRLAVGASGDERRQQLLNKARTDLFEPRWLSSTYDLASRPRRVDPVTGEAIAAVDLEPPEADTHQGDGDSPRQVLLRATRRGVGRSLRDKGGSVIAGRLTDIIGTLPLDGLTDGVVPAPQFVDPPGLAGLEPVPPSAEWFSAPAELPDLLDRLRPMIVAIRATSEKLGAETAWGGTGVVIREDGLIATNRHVADLADTLEIVLPDGRRVPARVHRLSQTTDLALVAPAEGIDLPPLAWAGLAEAGDVEQGQAVVTLGHPNLERGEPTFSWGLVTAVDRRIGIRGGERWGFGELNVLQHSYASSGGASGSPVFDLAGQIVGIHCAGSGALPTLDDSPAYMSFSVPVADLHALIDDAEVQLEQRARSSRETMTELTASELLGELLTPGRTVALAREHWRDRESHGEDQIGIPTGAGAPSLEEGVALVVPAVLTEASAPNVEDITGPIGYLTPLRVLAHRMDASIAIDPSRIASCEPDPSSPNGAPPAPDPAPLDPVPDAPAAQDAGGDGLNFV